MAAHNAVMPSQEAGEKLEGPMASDPSTYPIDLVAVLLQEHEDILQRRKLLGLFKGAPDAVEGEKARRRDQHPARSNPREV